MIQQNRLLADYQTIRAYTLELMSGLSIEDHLAQSSFEASPPKWHLAHTTWFFENLILKNCLSDYQEFDPQYNYYFNSYYEALGPRIDRASRASLLKPELKEVHRYRSYVDEQMERLLSKQELDEAKLNILRLGLNHEQQHQELFLTDYKKALANEILPRAYRKDFKEELSLNESPQWLDFPAGLYEIGNDGSTFHFDNEAPRHKVYLEEFAISSALVTNADWLEFIEAGAYSDPQYWHMDGWEWLKEEKAEHPLYWRNVDNEWYQFCLSGLIKLNLKASVNHISFYEAYAFANWKGLRLPTEAEWEIAQSKFNWGERWEWTNSAYLPYPGYQAYEGAAREYNGKFMINQMILRGASVATPPRHSRSTYRNFFHPHFRWQFTGLRLAKNL